MTTEERPWGKYSILHSSSEFQVKIIEVNPGKRLSLQSHQFRAEHWFIVSGTGIATVGDNVTNVAAGDTIDIPVLVKHRISADEKAVLTFIEVQTGQSFEEEDIVRYEDDFGRK